MNGAFPILHDCSTVPEATKRTWPKWVPWEFVEKWRAPIEANHNRTLELLARSGGLTPRELWLAAHNRGLDELAVTDHVAGRWLIAELRGFDSGA